MDAAEFAGVYHLRYTVSHLGEIAGYAGQAPADEFVDGFVVVAYQADILSEDIAPAVGFAYQCEVVVVQLATQYYI